MVVAKVISGGQTGCDRAALDAAMELGIPVGGYVPLGRLAEDGRVPDRYPLEELPTADYPARTRRNVEHSDGTLILLGRREDLRGGTLLTLRTCERMRRPFAVVDMQYGQEGIARTFLYRTMADGRDMHGAVLNVAGPRESGSPGVYAKALAFLLEVLRP